MTNLERLAELLVRVTGVESGKTPEETIKRAVQAIKTSKSADTQVQRQLSKVAKLSEEEMYGGAEELPTFSDYIRNKFAGEPSVKSWAAIELANIGRLDGLKNREIYKKKITDYSEGSDLEPREIEDNEFDAENGIGYQSIDDFINNLSVVDYLTSVYDDDELDFSDFEDFEDPTDPEEFQEDEKQLKECEEIISTSFNAAELMESLSRQARIKLKIAMRRNKAKIAQKRKIALRRHSTTDVLKRRARKLALKMLKQRFAHKAVSDMSMADKERVEKILQSKKRLVDRLTMKMIPVVRKIEQERFKTKE